MIKKGMYLAIGASLAYLFDPVSGGGRRARLADQLASRIRRMLATAGKRARYEVGRAKGWYHTRHHEPSVPQDDETLVQKIRSEAVGPAAVANGDIEVHVEAGVVVLKGVSRDAMATQDLFERVARVPGVRKIRDEMTPVPV